MILIFKTAVVLCSQSTLGHWVPDAETCIGDNSVSSVPSGDTQMMHIVMAESLGRVG